jgi:lysophospholipase L1-like esterase
MRIVVAADSLALPRRKPEAVGFYEVWPTLLEARLMDLGISARILNHGQRGLTLPVLVQRFDDIIGFWESDVVIFQVGIVDCAPRLFGPRQQSVLSSWLFPRFLSRLVIGAASRFRRQIITARPWIRFTPPNLFRRSLAELAVCLKDSSAKVIVLPILGTFPEHERRSPGYTESVQLYNAAWREWCEQCGHTFLEYEKLFGQMEISQVVASDGHHLTPSGNRDIAEALAGVVRTRTKDAD